MSTVLGEPVALPGKRIGRRRKGRVAGEIKRVRLDGKFFRLGDAKFYVKGVTYGPFAPNRQNEPFGQRQQVRKDFGLIRELGANCIRIYHVPPRWLLELA